MLGSAAHIFVVSFLHLREITPGFSLCLAFGLAFGLTVDVVLEPGPGPKDSCLPPGTLGGTELFIFRKLLSSSAASSSWLRIARAWVRARCKASSDGCRVSVVNSTAADESCTQPL